MFHKQYIAGTNVCNIPREEFELRQFMSERKEGIANASALLAGKRGARLVDSIQEGLARPGPLTRRMERLFLELHSILHLEDAHNNPGFEFGCLNMLEPEDAVLAEICLLADGLDDALRAADIIPNLGESAA